MLLFKVFSDWPNVKCLLNGWINVSLNVRKLECLMNVQLAAGQEQNTKLKPSYIKVNFSLSKNTENHVIVTCD